MIVALEEMKGYLRVDFDDDDSLIQGLIDSATQFCMDIARVLDIETFEKEPCSKVAVMYAVAYLYEHREDADHKSLAFSVRGLLFGSRREVF